MNIIRKLLFLLFSVVILSNCRTNQSMKPRKNAVDIMGYRKSPCFIEKKKCKSKELINHAKY